MRKHEIVDVLRDLNARGRVEIGHDRRWRVRRANASGATNQEPRGDDRIHALPARAIEGVSPGEGGDALPQGRLAPDLDLLKRLLPYYQEALKAADGGQPIETLSKAGQRFVLLQPDGPWWPTQERGRRLRISRSLLPPAFLETVAKSARRRLLLGYPLLLITPRDEDSEPFAKPVATIACNFDLSETALELDVPAVRPSINQDWLKEQKRYANWDTAELRSWLLFEDRGADVRPDDDVETPDFVEIPAFAERLDAALKRSVQGTLDPATIIPSLDTKPEIGLYNGLALLADVAGKFTRTAIRDYDRLIALDTADFRGTAVAPVLGVERETAEQVPIIHPFPMGESQLLAARAGLAGPLTTMTGPPGTGKSQVIAALMVSAAAAGKSVLFAARQHRALDAVQERLEEVAGERTVLVRANESDGAGGFSFRNAVQALLTRPDAPEAQRRFTEPYRRLAQSDRDRWVSLDAWRELARQSDRAAQALARVETAEDKLARLNVEAQAKGLPTASDRPQPRGWLGKLLARFLRRLGLSGGPGIGTVRALRQAETELRELQSALGEAERAVAEQRNLLKGTEDTAVEKSGEIIEDSKPLVPRLLDRLETLSSQERQQLTALAGESALEGGGTAPLGDEAAALVLKHLPLWGVTTLAAGSRIPCVAGLFDYVIFDEAAQTDIASALPLLYRAKTAVVAGDPQQLAMIANLDPRAERDLLRQYDLFRPGIGRFAQGRTSLFDLAASAEAGRRFLLTEHYRCHPEIAGYINEAFYGRRLQPLTDVTRLRVPAGMKAGLQWSDVQGPIRARTGGHSRSAGSEAEADAIAAQINQLVDGNFEGTIGVVAFFDYQSQLITSRLQGLSASARDRHALKVFTANKFQGDERDVILFSLCLGPDMPSGARNFIRQEKRLLNVAVSRARAVCHVFGDLNFAGQCGIAHVETLARRFRQSQDREAGRFDDRFDSPWERRLYDALAAKGLSPQPQYPAGGRFLDLALIDEARKPPLKLDIEVDGFAYHADEAGDRLATDLWRDHQLRGLGWKVLRFWVYELRDDMEGCVEQILAENRA